MSKKAVKSMKHENPELQKQIGCITGFFQLFDSHRFLTGQHTSSHSQHRLTSGGSGNDIKKQIMQKAMAKNLKVAREKQQFSTESSINSMSSSPCSSSLSSFDYNRTIQTESPSANRMRISDNPNSEVAMKQLGIPGQKSLNFYDIAKDSIHREAQSLSVKTVAKEEKKGQTHKLKYIDSPRPLQSHKSVNAGVKVANEPIHIFAKSKKTHCDSPRFSYDGRDIKDTMKSTTKHKEIPRLSLDSREGSIRGFNEGNKSCNLLKGPEKGYGRNSTTMLSQQREPETSKRSSSVVAKLMGLEAPPDWTQTCESSLGTSSHSTEKYDIFTRSSTSDEYKQHQSSVSQRTCQRSNLPQSRRVDSIARVSTPWSQLDASQSSQLQASKGSESDIKALRSSLSVYGEIKERLAEREFKKSGKDLRALKQILEAMHRYKDSFDITKDQASNSPSGIRNNTRFHESSKVQSPRMRLKEQRSVTDEMSNSTQGSKSAIVIMKPAKVKRKANNTSSREMPIHGKSGLNKCFPGNHTSGRLVNKQTAKGISPSADKCDDIRTSKLMQSLKVSGDINGKNTTNSSNLTVTGSPRLQNKYGSERRSPPTSPSSDCNINRKQNRQSAELTSQSRTPRKKISILQERKDHIDDHSCRWRDFKHHVNVISPDFDSKGSLVTDSDIEVIHIDQSRKINSTSIHGLNQNNATEELRKESYKAETIITAEQPSPVSVLDAGFYREDPPSPVKKKSDISKDLGEALSANDDSDENSMNLHPLSSPTKANFSNGSIDRDMNTQNLVQILQEIEWIDEKFINFNDNKVPDHKYISEILLSSGLLSFSSSSQIFHSSGHLINPKLFFALEQTMTNKRHSNTEDSAKKIARIINLEQMQRKLLFDVVNEILVRKLVSDSSSSMRCIPNELAGRKLKGQQLLGEICTEIDQLQPQNKNVSLANEDDNLTSLMLGDLMHHHPTIWTNCCSELPNIVLDIERLIFKDLIGEVMRGEEANHPGRHCRQLLFPK